MKIEELDYIIINCGYTARLESHVNRINKYCKEIYGNNSKLLFIHDDIWGSGLIEYNEKGLYSKLLKLKDLNIEKSGGIICFKVESLHSSLDICKHLMKYKHCAFFHFTTLCAIECFDFDEKKIAKLTFDTGSG